MSIYNDFENQRKKKEFVKTLVIIFLIVAIIAMVIFMPARWKKDGYIQAQAELMQAVRGKKNTFVLNHLFLLQRNLQDQTVISLNEDLFKNER